MDDLIEKFSELNATYVSGFKILKDCDEFYNRTKSLLLNSTTTHIASLSFGESGRMEGIIDILEERKRRNLQTVIFIDKNRSSQDDFKSMRKRGLMEFLHPIDLTGYTFLPRRMSELLGVFHTKALVFDDVVLLSGANMDTLYMENRVDRYLEVESKELADMIRSRVFGVESTNSTNPISNNHDSVYIGMFNGKQEMSLMRRLMDEEFDSIHISTAYLNFPDEYLEMFNGRRISLYASCPDANSFNSFTLIGGIIGSIYRYAFYRTLKRVPTLSIYEFIKNGCTFHEKGIWAFKDNVAITIIGSSNFNRRSTERDEEMNYLIITSDPHHIKMLRGEVSHLRSKSQLRSFNELKNRTYTFISILMFIFFNRFL